MNDDDMLAAARSSLTGTKDALRHVHMEQRPEAIMARARGRRLRRGLPAISAGSLALGIGLALSLSGAHPGGTGGPPTASGGGGSRAVHVNLAAWSVNTSSTGVVNVTIRELKDPARLAKTLAHAGVPVFLTAGRVCASGDDPQLSRVVRKLPGHGDLVIKINPEAMPDGMELVIGIGKLRMGSRSGPAAAFGLEKQGSTPNCPGKGKKVTS